MTYLHRVAKRTACVVPGVAALALLVVACTKGEKVDFLGPNPHPSPAPAVQTLRVEPLIAAVQIGSDLQFSATGYTATGQPVALTVDWTAAGGDISPTGLYTGRQPGVFTVVGRARNAPGVADSARVSVWGSDNQLVQLLVFPDSAIVDVGDSLQATAALLLASGDITFQASVEWSASGGTIDDRGMFRASGPGMYRLTAVSPAGLRGEAAVLVRPKLVTLVGVGISPLQATAVPGQQIAFTVASHWSDGGTQPADVDWSAAGGTISPAGIYTAGSMGGQFAVIARNPQSGLADTARVTVVPASVVGVSISPKGVTTQPGASNQFSALALMSDGTWRTVPMSWQATGGAIDAGGLFTAPAQPGSVRVIVSVVGADFADTATVGVVQPAATLTRVRVNPSSAIVPVGGTRLFSAIAEWSDGSNSVPLVAWSATGGTISPGGLYVAGTAPGVYRVIGTHPSGLADTSDVVITPPALTGLVLTPVVASVVSGQSVQFAVAGIWSDGGAAAPAVVWSAGGGAIAPSGLYVAGSVPGTYAVIAVHQGGTVADTSLVTVTPAPPTLTGLLLTPGSTVLAPGAARQFSVSGTWSDGGTAAPPVTFTATGGSITPGGVYTAGASTGTWRVIATHAASGKADTSSVIISNPVTLTTLAIAPQAVSLLPGASQQFTVNATWSNGSTAVPLVNWSATGGAMGGSGRYVAGATPGTYRVIVVHQGGTRADTADVTVLGTPPPAPTLTSLTLAPKPVSVAVSGTQQFALSALWSDGSTSVPAVTWAATGGAISGAGLYTASAVAGSYRVIATHQGGTLADTVAVTVTATPPPTLTSLTVAPKPTAVTAGSSRQFTLSALWSNGSTTVPAVSWSATGGTISAAGLYTAGTSAGTYRVVATYSSGVKADTSAVTVTPAGPPPPPPMISNPHMPAGYASIVERAFNTLATYTGDRGVGSYPNKSGGSEGWDDVEKNSNNLQLANDPTAPLSGPSVLGFRYDAGPVAFGQTYTPGPAQSLSFGGSRRKMYVHFAMKLSANFQYHTTGLKLMFFRSISTPGGKFEPILSISNGGNLQMNPQGTEDNARGNLQANAGSGALTRNQWYDVEVVLEMNSAYGVPDGVFKVWLNGNLVMNYADIKYLRDSTNAYVWDVLHVNPTWGGQGGTINQTQYLYFDHFYVGGR